VAEADGIVGGPSVGDPNDAHEDGSAEDDEVGTVGLEGGDEDERPEEGDDGQRLEKHLGDGVARAGAADGSAAEAIDEEGEREDGSAAEADDVGELLRSDAQGGDGDDGPVDYAGDGHGLGAGGEEVFTKVVEPGGRVHAVGGS